MAIIDVTPVTVAIVALITLAAGEVVVRALAPHLPELLEWRDWECHHKAKVLLRLADQGGASVVFVGSSVSNAAFDPAQATEIQGLPRPAFNASLNAATMRTLELWTRDLILPRLRPTHLILGVFSGDMNDNSLVGSAGFEMFRSSIGWRRVRPGASAAQRLLVAAEKHSFLVRYRHFIREPGAWGIHRSVLDRWRLLRGNLRSRFSKQRGVKAGCTPLGDLERLSIFRGVPYGPPRERMLASWRRIVHEYDAGGAELQALNRLVDSVTRAGVEALVVRMPVTPDWVPFHPNGGADFDRFVRTLEGFAADRRVRYLDLSKEFGSLDEFVDALHLNDVGRKRFTSIVCAELSGSVGEVSQR